jgi:integrase
MWKGKREKIYSNKQGQVLEGYQQALALQFTIHEEITTGRFDLSKYRRTQVQKFWVKSLLDEFRAKKKASLAPSYQPNYKVMADAGKNFFADQDVREIRKVDLVRYKDQIEAKGFSPKTVKNYLDLFRAFLWWCRNELEILDMVPSFPRVELPKVNFAWVEREDQIRLFNAVPEPHKPFIKFLMLHGCRPGEGRALRVKDIDLARQNISIHATFSAEIYLDRRKGRGAKDVEVPIHPECLQDITERIPGKLLEAYLFCNPRTGKAYSNANLQDLWDVVRKKTGIDKTLRLYDATRHSAASQLINRGESLVAVSRLLGHSSVKMTERYAHGDIERVRASIEKLSLNKVVSVHGLSVGEKVEKIVIKKR